jgi:hypothetical protein
MNRPSLPKVIYNELWFAVYAMVDLNAESPILRYTSDLRRLTDKPVNATVSLIKKAPLVIKERRISVNALDSSRSQAWLTRRVSTES